MDKEYDGVGVEPHINTLLKTSLFSMIAVMIIVSIAVPIISHVGENTLTENNEGIRYSDIADELNEYATQYPEKQIILTIDTRYEEENPSKRVIYLESYDNITHETQHIKTYLTYDQLPTMSSGTPLVVYISKDVTDTTNGTTWSGGLHSVSPSMFGAIFGEEVSPHEILLSEYNIARFIDDVNTAPSNHTQISFKNDQLWMPFKHLFIPNPDGEMIATMEIEGVKCESTDQICALKNITALGVQSDEVHTASIYFATEGKAYNLVTDRTNPSHETCTVATTTPSITTEEDEHGNYIIEEYGHTEEQAYDLCFAPYSTYYTVNIIDGSAIKTIISLIPLLMIVGIVLLVVRNMRVSDR